MDDETRLFVWRCVEVLRLDGEAKDVLSRCCRWCRSDDVWLISGLTRYSLQAAGDQEGV